MKFPCGNGPDAHAHVLLKAGVRVFDHPITPFEDLVVRCAAGCASPVLEVVRELQRMQRTSPASDPAVGLCLDWIEARILAASERRRFAQSLQARHVAPYVARAHESIDLATRGLKP